MNRAVADASAVLAMAFQETGWRQAEALIVGSLISAVNAAEVTSRLLARDYSADQARLTLSNLYLDIRPLDAELALLTGQLHQRTRPHGLSLADCACLTLASVQRLPAVTADRAWRSLAMDVEIVLIR